MVIFRMSSKKYRFQPPHNSASDNVYFMYVVTKVFLLRLSVSGIKILSQLAAIQLDICLVLYVAWQ